MFIEFVGTTALKGGVRPPGMSAVQIAEANALNATATRRAARDHADVPQPGRCALGRVDDPSGAFATSGTGTTTTSVTRAFDTADRPTTGANNTGTYVYDALGRTITVPALDAPKPGRAGPAGSERADRCVRDEFGQGWTGSASQKALRYRGSRDSE
jgi:hypothetical protein